MSEDQNIEQSTDDRPQLTEDKNISELQLTNYQPPTENMEVHHSHHSTHKKKWGEFVLEFFMLFLAVFLGFIAENFRENLVEKKREREYIKSIIEDVKTDTAKMAVIIPFNEQQVKGLDSLTNYLYNSPYSDFAIHNMYYLQACWGNNYFPMKFTRRTIDQLQNAGGMHLIRDKTAADAIIRYYETATGADNQLKVFVDNFQLPALKASYSIFDGSYFIGLTRATLGTLINDQKKYTLLSTDNSFLKNYANQTQETASVLKNYLYWIKLLREDCINLINVLQKEYNLK